MQAIQSRRDSELALKARREIILGYADSRGPKL